VGAWHLGADNSHLQYTGRMAMNNTKALWEWAGTRTLMRLDCPASGMEGLMVSAHIDLPTYPEKGKYAWLVDGMRVEDFVVDKSGFFSMGLTPGVHTIELVKNSEHVSIPMMWSKSEGQQPTMLLGFDIPDDCKLLDPPPRLKRRMELIGDSITCGFGNLRKNLGDYLKCVMPPNGWRDYEDFLKALPSLAGASFAAEVHTQCISNIGVTRNGDTLAKTTPYNASHYMHRALPTLPGAEFEWDYSSWVPDIGVINLGTNDYDLSQFVAAAPPLAVFQAALSSFVKGYVSRYQGKLAALVLVCGPMTSQQCPAVAGAAQDVSAAFPKLKVRYADVKLEKLEGCILHPDTAGDERMLEQLTPVIKELTSWDTNAEPMETVVV